MKWNEWPGAKKSRGMDELCCTDGGLNIYKPLAIQLAIEEAAAAACMGGSHVIIIRAGRAINENTDKFQA